MSKTTKTRNYGTLCLQSNWKQQNYRIVDKLLHSAVGSNQVGCSYTSQRSLSFETNTRATEEIPALNQSWRVFNNPTSNWPYQDPQVPNLVLRTTHCSQTLNIDHTIMECAVLQECYDEFYTADSLNTLETIPETCMVEFRREAGLFYLIWMVRHSLQFITWISPDLMGFVNFN